MFETTVSSLGFWRFGSDKVFPFYYGNRSEQTGTAVTGLSIVFGCPVVRLDNAVGVADGKTGKRIFAT